MVASLQGHYSCIIAYIPRVHFIYTEYMQNICKLHSIQTAETHIMYGIYRITYMAYNIWQLYYTMVEGVCSSAAKDINAPDDIAAGISIIDHREPW